MNELIEKLKDKNYVRAFGLMEETLPGSQAVYQTVGKKNCLVYGGGIWTEPGNKDSYYFPPTDTFAISPDYQPEPEYVDLEIKKVGSYFGTLSVDASKIKGVTPHDFTYLYELPSLPNFECFWCQSLGSTTSNLGLHHIATLFREGKTVYARLRKE